MRDILLKFLFASVILLMLGASVCLILLLPPFRRFGLSQTVQAYALKAQQIVSSAELDLFAGGSNNNIVLIPTGTGAVIAFNIDQVIKVDALSGADFGAKLLACQTLLASTGGVCDARGLTGAWNLSTQTSITVNNLKIILSPTLVVTQSAALAFTGTSGASPLLNTTIEGNGATFLLAAASSWTQPANNGTDGYQSHWLWQLTNVRNMTISGVIFDVNKTNQSVAAACWNGLGLYGVNRVHIEKNVFQNVPRHALGITSDGQTTPVSAVSSDVWVRDNEFSVYGVPSTTAQCTSGDMGGASSDSGAVSIQNGVNNTSLVPQNFWIQNNRMDSGYVALDVLPQGSAMANIWFENNDITAPTGSGNGFAQMVIEGTLNSGSTAALGHHGIHINRNHMDASAMLGIYFAQGSQLEAVGNVFTNQSAPAIYEYSVLGGLSDVTIADNKLYGSGAVGILSQQHTNAIAHTQIHGNLTSGFTTGITVLSDTQAGNTNLQVYGNDGQADTAAVSFPASFPSGMSTQFLCDSSLAVWNCSNGGTSSSLVPFGNVGTTSLGLNLSSNTTITMTLTANSGLGTITNPPAGTLVTFEIVDPGAAYTFTWTTASCGGGCSWKGGMSMTGSKTNVQTFLYDGTNYVATGSGLAN